MDECRGMTAPLSARTRGPPPAPWWETVTQLFIPLDGPAKAYFARDPSGPIPGPGPTPTRLVPGLPRDHTMVGRAGVDGTHGPAGAGR